MVAAHPTRLAIQGGMQRNNVAFEPCTQLGVHHRPTVKRSDTESMASRIVLASLRIWNDWMICTRPSTTSHTPVTKTSTTIESKGQTRTTRPAITEMTPRTTYQPRPGRFDSPIAAAMAEIPWKIKPIPIHSDSRRIACIAEVAEGQNGQ